MQACTLTCLPLTHMKSSSPQGEEEIIGTTLVRKWGRRPGFKKRKEQRLRYGECCWRRSNLFAMFIQVCGLILAYGTLCTAPSGKNTQTYLHASDYSAVTAKNDIFAPLLTIKHLHFIQIWLSKWHSLVGIKPGLEEGKMEMEKKNQCVWFKCDFVSYLQHICLIPASVFAACRSPAGW